MELKFITEKNVHGLTTRTDNASEMTPTKGKIAGLWQTFDETVPVDYKSGERVYGIYMDYESDHTGQFTVLAGFDGENFPASVDLTHITIPKGQYLVFTHKGEMPQIAIDAWTEVWHYFLEERADYQRCYSLDFEYYPNGNEVQVHIAVK